LGVEYILQRGYPVFLCKTSLTFGKCDTTACDVKEWNDIYDNTGTITDLLALEKQTNLQHLLALRHDPFMFHQANMRQTDVDTTVVNGVSGRYSLLQMWVETVTTELTRM